ncbi:sensor histidine kinase [Clostridium oryzae]|uniref:histidine kinase n=1 Tax=Clostridium oryzae TaxID=1450648 RepID=A0A1V4IHA5_9CLOT|nr:ATP-binding protein [Clostridium oryzae]OPJ59230.1 sensor histidine kinase YycG [Clostridium oryzae]
MNSNEEEKVIVLKSSTVKIVSLAVKGLISFTIAVGVPLLLDNGYELFHIQYLAEWSLFHNDFLIGFFTFLVSFVLLINIRRIENILNIIHDFSQGYTMKSIGVEILVVNVISISAAEIVYHVALRISCGDRFSSFLLAAPVYFVVFHFMAGKKIRYIREITTGIQEISSGNLEFKLVEKGNDEFTIMARNINSMSALLKDKIEDERRSEQTKNELITNVSHDLKTPLTTIIGYLTLVKDKNYDNEGTMNDYIDRAYSKSLRLKKLIEDLFEYTKISNGVIKINKSNVNIVELMEQLLGEMSILAKQNDLSFEKNYSSNEIYADVDSDLMARAFENILSNSIKYSYKELDSKIIVSIIQNKDNVLISFENQGDTIPTEILPLLFERFYRVDKSRNSKISGSGLGLAIAKNIVELHGGNISAESEANTVKISVKLYN